MTLAVGPDILSTPAAPTVVQNAQGAGAAITYTVVAVNVAGQDSLPSATTTTGANNAATPNNTINWVLQAGQAQTRVLKNGALLATVGPGVTSYTDSAGSAGVSYTAATSNPQELAPVANSPIDGGKATYSASITNLVPASSATDIFTLTGSASKTVRITHVVVSGTSTAATAAALDCVLLKRSTADTSGTSTNPTAVPYDRNSPAATATINAYTANPTTGTLVGNLHVQKLMLPLATDTSTDFPPMQPIMWDFGNRPSQAIVLRGTGDVFAINLNGVTPTATASFDISVEWSEE